MALRIAATIVGHAAPAAPLASGFCGTCSARGAGGRKRPIHRGRQAGYCIVRRAALRTNLDRIATIMEAFVAATLATEVWPCVRSCASRAWNDLEKAVRGSFQRHFLQFTGAADLCLVDCTFAIRALALNALRRQQSSAIMADCRSKTPDRRFLVSMQESLR
jgi:hypothetical protein